MSPLFCEKGGTLFKGGHYLRKYGIWKPSTNKKKSDSPKVTKNYQTDNKRPLKFKTELNNIVTGLPQPIFGRQGCHSGGHTSVVSPLPARLSIPQNPGKA